MNIFILNTGRCGSMSFIQACQHITNYSSAHESRCHLIGDERLNYPARHIEADNRLSWFLGRLDQVYGNSAFYVHLSRAKPATVASFARRGDFGIMQAYREGILLGGTENQSASDIAADYIETVEANIVLFLKDKQHKMLFTLETAKQDFVSFWKTIGAEGDLAAALREWDIPHNASI